MRLGLCTMNERHEVETKDWGWKFAPMPFINIPAGKFP
jgi:hypothetical protein